MVNNTLEIEINPILFKKEKKAGFSFLIKIDGKPINDNHHVDLYEILYLVTKPERDFIYFWNCDCGIPECAGIESSQIKKNKNTENLMIVIPIPCSTNDFKEKSYKYWQENHKKKVIRLNKTELAKNLWELSFVLEKKMEEISKGNQLLFWPASTAYYDFEWPVNLPVYIRTALLKNGYKN